LKDRYEKNIAERYKVAEMPQTSEELFELVGRKRGFLQKGGVIDTEKTAIAVLKDFRAGKLGNISLEEP
ncbi:MAG TPA: ribosome biogenesis GTPase YlqF, partial [Megamonas hypermegale]|nr:ribosome biogenesis GTPase YlqF [Megamonas hypermegale]